MTKDETYQALQAELQLIVTKLQEPDIDLDEAMQSYERGLLVIRKLEAFLTQAEGKVIKLQRQSASDS